MTADVERYSISWYERVTVTIPCRWRSLLGLPLRTMTKLHRREMSLQYDAQQDRLKSWIDSESAQVQVQVEYVWTDTARYKNFFTRSRK